MYIAHNALRPTANTSRKKPIKSALAERFEAYNITCNKYQNEIAAIQKYLPGWMPAFHAHG